MANKAIKSRSNKSPAAKSRKGLSIYKNRWRGWFAVAFTVLLATAAAWIYYSQLPLPSPEPPVATQQSAPKPKAKSHPLVKLTAQEPNRIKIAKAEIDALIVPVGVTADGAMAAPDSATDVGWYDKSAMLGSSEKAMLLDGHYGLDSPEVFRNLTKLRIGDEIEVMGVNGDKAVFKVSEVERTAREKVDMEKAYYYGGKEEALSIITCIGDYDQALQTYDERYIVYAKRSQ